MWKRSRRYVSRTIWVGIGTVCIIAALSGCPRSPSPGETRTFDGIEFQWCPAGTFTMGSPEGEEGRREDEAQHEVTLTQGFWLGKYEVTQAHWEAVMGTNPSGFPSRSRPVDTVSWEDAQEFIAQLNAGRGPFARGHYRLPTEAEWEHACRAGTSERFYWGGDPDGSDIDTYAWYESNSHDESQVVGEKLPNRWGLFDMSGNIAEWCQDWYGDYPNGPVTDPEGPDLPEPGLEERILRGGDWEDRSRSCRSASRNYHFPDFRIDEYGFRLLRTAD